MIRAGQVLMQRLTPTGPEVFTRQYAPTDESNYQRLLGEGEPFAALGVRGFDGSVGR